MEGGRDVGEKTRDESRDEKVGEGRERKGPVGLKKPGLL